MNVCNDNCTNMEIFYDMTEEIWSSWNKVGDYFEYRPWVFSLLGSTLVGLSGIFPLFIIPIDEGTDLKNGAGAGTLKILLSFAVGGLLGDVFLHLLPEAWGNKLLKFESTGGHPSILCGLWVLGGFLVFIIAEKIFIGDKGNDDDDGDYETDTNKIGKLAGQVFLNNNHDKTVENNNMLSLDDKINEHTKFLTNSESNLKEKNGYIIHSMPVAMTKNRSIISSELNKLYSEGEMQKRQIISALESNGFDSNGAYKKVILKTSMTTNNSLLNGKLGEKRVNDVKIKRRHISGYLNLLANCIDNFTHGLAVGGSFLVSFRLGALTTFAILIHEIPHEVGDFAILLKSGFNRWDAARAQLLTATGGIFGALIAVLCSGSGVESRTSWILPFTAGGFLHIGLVTILPELLKESNPKESIKQLGALIGGIMIMALLTIICD